MWRIIVYGYGKMFQLLRTDIEECDIVAIADQRAHLFDNSTEKCPIVLPEDIDKYSYDYIAITPLGSYERIKQYLIGEYGISEEKIISFYLFTNHNIKATIESNKLPFSRGIVLDYPIQNTEREKYGIYEDFVRCSTAYCDLYKPQDNNNPTKKVDFFVMTHRKYVCFSDEVYHPLALGGYREDDYLDESSGENISYLNNKINENTGIYWVWKNYSTDIVGITHYRRYFYNDELRCRENRLTGYIAERLVLDYDFLVWMTPVPNNKTVEEQLIDSIGKDAYTSGLHIFFDEMTKHQPEYLKDFKAVLRGKELCYCNMFVTTWDRFDAYCSWLFSFLIPSAERFQADDYTGNDRRVIGYLAERMLSVWVTHNNLTTKPMPTYTE